jgi:hypothetical protein
MNKPSRRAVVRTGVWAVPAVATVAAAPAFAGSPGTPVTIESAGAGCKLPGKSYHNGKYWWGYRIYLTFDNSSSTDQVVVITGFNITGKTTTDLNPTVVTVPPGQSSRVFIVQSTDSSMRSATLNVTYTVDNEKGSAAVAIGCFKPCDCAKGQDPGDPNSGCTAPAC